MKDELRARWYRIMNKGSELNRACPWIYSDKWYEMFAAELIEAFQIDDDKELEKVLTDWEQEFRMS